MVVGRESLVGRGQPGDNSVVSPLPSKATAEGRGRGVGDTRLQADRLWRAGREGSGLCAKNATHHGPNHLAPKSCGWVFAISIKVETGRISFARSNGFANLHTKFIPSHHIKEP